MEISEGDYILGLWNIVDPGNQEVLQTVLRRKDSPPDQWEVHVRTRIVMDDKNPFEGSADQKICNEGRATCSEEEAIKKARNFAELVRTAMSLDSSGKVTTTEVLIRSDKVDDFLKKVEEIMPGQIQTRRFDTKEELDEYLKEYEKNNKEAEDAQQVN